MTLVAGTESGIYRAASPTGPFERTRRTDRVLRVEATPNGVFAASRSGLFRSTDGTDWERVDTPRDEVYSVAVSPDGDRLYVGTHPAHIYESGDGGATWTELDAFQKLPSRETWHTPRHRNSAHVRSLVVHPDAPDRLVAGVEVGGVHVSDDRGATWTERRSGLHDDVHHVLAVDPGRYVAATGDGLYRTTDAGRSWKRLDRAVDRRYFRESLLHDGTLSTAAAAGPPGTWSGERGADAAVFESTDGGDTLAVVSTPVTPAEIVLGWTVAEGRVIAGTNGGTMLERSAQGWNVTAEVPHGIRSLASV